jgi:ATP-dependent helicase/nuclease subunit B
MREVICGPFHSGHRALWAEKFREDVRAGRAHRSLYLVPTRGLASVVRRLVLEGLHGVAGEQVLTLFGVVEDILAKSDTSYIRLDALAAERLVAKVMRRLPGEWNGKPLEEW